MGHQFPRAVAAAALTFVAACGGGDGADEPVPVLDNARRQVADDVATGEQATEEVETVAVDELPAPDPSTFVGANRIVNLWVGPDGATTTVDLWGRRTFSNGPILLVRGLAFGEVSEHVGAPSNYELSIVGTGAGPDAPEIADVVTAADGEQITTVFTNADDVGTARSTTVWERGADQAPEPPRPDRALVQLVTANLSAVDDRLVRSVGTESFLVGDGAGSCRAGRVDEQPVVVRPASDAVLEVDPGPVSLSLHPSIDPPACDSETIASITVDVAAGSQVLAVVYSRDGESIEMLSLPAG